MSKGRMKNPYPKLEAQKVFDLVKQVRETIPEHLRATPKKKPWEDTRMRDASNEEEFELLAIADALGELAEELHESIEKANAKILQDCLKVYYATEELVKDPKNAHLKPHLEEMRKAYEESYGQKIPPKKG